MGKNPASLSDKLRLTLLPIKRRLFVIHLLCCLSYGLAGGLILLLALMVVSRFIYPFAPVPWAYLSVGLPLAAAGIIALFTGPDFHAAARTGDAFGLEERLVTALEVDDTANPWAEAQVADAVKYGRNVDVKKIPLRLHKKALVTSLVLAAVLAVIPLVPSPTAAVLARRQADAKKIAAQREKVAQLVEKLEEHPEEIDKEAVTRLKQLERELKKASSLREALKKMSSAQDDLKKIAGGEREKQLEKMATALSQINHLQKLGRALQSGDKEAIAAAAGDLAKRLAEMSPKERQAVLEQLESMAGSIPQAAGEKLLQAVQALQQGQGSAGALANSLTGALARAGTGINGAMAQLAEIKQGLTGQQLALGGNGGSGQGGLLPGSDGNQQGGTGQGENNTTGSGTGGQGNTGAGQSGSGSGSGQGTGSGSGPGTAGSGGGAGLGTGSGSGGTSAGGNGQPGANNLAEPILDIRRYEKVFAPSRLGDGGTPTRVSGQPNERIGSDYLEVHLTPNQVEQAAVPYRQVLGQYAAEAHNSIERAEVPPRLQDMVRKYFASLE